MKIILICGGWSREREVSLNEAGRVGKTLEKLGHEVLFFDPAEELENLIAKAQGMEFAYICLHSDDGMIRAILDQVGCPYVGSHPGAISLSKNKVVSKMFFIRNGILTPDWEYLVEPPDAGWKTRLSWPIVAKPSAGGSSIGVSIVDNEEKLAKAIAEIFALDDKVLLETWLPGPEIACGILGNEALPPILIKPKSAGFFDYASKYTPGEAEEICPAPIEKDLSRKIQQLALETHNILGLKGYSRTDFIICNGEPWVLEINSQSGLADNSLLPKEALAAGISFETLIEKLIENGLRDSEERNRFRSL